VKAGDAESRLRTYKAALGDAQAARRILKKRCDELIAERDAANHERDRITAWLRYVTIKARGMGRDLARQALWSTSWPRLEAAKKARRLRRRIPLEKMTNG